jgi:hypothetical protein
MSRIIWETYFSAKGVDRPSKSRPLGLLQVSGCGGRLQAPLQGRQGRGTFCIDFFDVWSSTSLVSSVVSNYNEKFRLSSFS